ncbi:MAG TPA: NAD(P)H-hydrate dehydratase, partial [Thermoleophilia bacterium]|nr:NAD(P)H-hydrate dehydratase [Thermoleophilia bacterium]
SEVAMSHEAEDILRLYRPAERPEAFSPEQMRGLDSATIEEIGLPGPVLMERAALGVSRLILERFPGRHTLIVCGRGNNAGDGLAAGRQLHLAGHPVAVVVVADSIEELSADAALQFRAAERSRVNLRLGAAAPDYLWDEAELIVDCLLGTGATGELRDPVPEWTARINRAGAGGSTVLAVDVPTGVDAGSGAIAQGTVAADLTITFHAAKTGILCPPGAEAAGEVLIWDIGVPRFLEPAPELRVVTAKDARIPGPRPDDHKYSAGYLLVVAGSAAYPGAALLTSRAATRGGAGYVKLLTTQPVMPLVVGFAPEVVVQPVTDAEAVNDVEALLAAAADDRVGALALGPGLGRNEDTMKAVRRLVRETRSPGILDADALHAFNGRLEELRGRPGLVLSPHAGELASLLQAPMNEVAASHLAAVRRATEISGQVVLLKGSSTLIADPGGDVWVVDQGPPELATAGTGDVLTGLVGALLARGLEPRPAARTGAWVHAEAGRRIAATRGAGLVAEDVAEELATVVAEQMYSRRPKWTN